MSVYNESDYLNLSGIQHFAFCRRQWALFEIEGIWKDNFYTTDGTLKHKRVHNPFLAEKRKNIITIGEMPVHSRNLGISGKCDIVEFVQNDRGVSLSGRNGHWLPHPVEYKRGSPKLSDADKLQLCAQAMCIEEMLLCPPIDIAYIFYIETRRREDVLLTETIRKKVKMMFEEMHSYFSRRYTPRVKPGKACKSCSLNDECLPKLPQSDSVATYINKALASDEP